MKLEITLLISYLLTVITELCMALLWRLQDRRSLISVFFVNTLTNPPLVLGIFIFSLLIPVHLIRPLSCLAEICILFLEGFLFKKAIPSLKRPYIFSLCSNTASFLAGILWSALPHLLT